MIMFTEEDGVPVVISPSIPCDSTLQIKTIKKPNSFS